MSLPWLAGPAWCKSHRGPAEGSLLSEAPIIVSFSFFFLHLQTSEPALLTYIFISTPKKGEEAEDERFGGGWITIKKKLKQHNRLRNETIMGPPGVLLFILTQRTNYAN